MGLKRGRELLLYRMYPQGKNVNEKKTRRDGQSFGETGSVTMHKLVVQRIKRQPDANREVGIGPGLWKRPSNWNKRDTRGSRAERLWS